MDDNKDLVKYKKRGKALALKPGDLTAPLQFGLAVFRKHGGVPAKYPNSPEGLRSFRDGVEGYFRYMQEVNEGIDEKQQMIPDIEGLSLYLGISRVTLLSYEKDRDQEWTQTVRLAKDVIAATKKQMLMRGKIPPLVGVFDLTNNHSYHNTSEFHLTATAEPTEKTKITLDDLPAIDAEFTDDDAEDEDEF